MAFWNEELEVAVNERKKARKAVQRDPCLLNKINYNKCSYKVKLIVKASKNKEWQRKTSQLDLRKDGKKAWKLLDKLSGKSKRTHPVPLETGSGKACTDSQKAEEHNKFFTSI